MHQRLSLAPLTLALVLGLIAPSAPARAEEMPSEIEWKLAELGAVIHPTETAKLYAPLQEKEPYQGIKVTRDVKYGPDARHALDVFTVEGAAGAPRPVLVYVHGGGFVAGSRRGPGSPFYDNVMLFAARNGMVGVNATYRLAPQNPWPAGAQDLGAAVRWVNENIAAHGGDPARVFLMGHSAGAVHVASYVAHGQFHGPKGIGLAGAILVSGLYDLAAMPAGGSERAYFGEDRSKYAERSPLPGLAKSPLPLMAVYAELDPDLFQAQAKQFNDTLCKAGRCPRLVTLAKHNHMSEVYALNTPDTSLSSALLTFVKAK
ncbi:MAG: alpha/beta hydrolase [Hyphomonadaceae bacterium]|jgi:triacylglycerol lipase|nr:alpha/beta hydrolase [Hyphomonadaceae bacterium]